MKILSKTNKFYPKRLLNIHNSPSKLYVEGNYELLNSNSIAIVGTRKCTEYGKKYSAKCTNCPKYFSKRKRKTSLSFFCRPSITSSEEYSFITFTTYQFKQQNNFNRSFLLADFCQKKNGQTITDN